MAKRVRSGGGGDWFWFSAIRAPEDITANTVQGPVCATCHARSVKRMENRSVFAASAV
jgi:ribosomal protein L37AE/L43A